MHATGIGQGRAREHGERTEQMSTMADEQDQLTKPKSAAQVESVVAAPPCAMVIFGAAGDLTRRLIVPALYNLTNAKRLSNGFRLVAVDHNARTVEQWRDGLTNTMKEFAHHDGEFQVDRINQSAWQWLTDRMTYLQGDFTDPRTYSRLRGHLAQRENTAGTAGNYLFYLAVSDRFFGTVVDGLAMAGLLTEGVGHWCRVVIEKP